MAKTKPGSPQTDAERITRRVNELIASRMARMHLRPGGAPFARGRLLATHEVMASAAYRLAEAAKFASVALEALIDAGTDLDRWLGKRSKKAAPKEASTKKKTAKRSR